MESFSQRLKRLRVAKGLTVKEIAKQIGVSVSTYREWEYGRAIQSIDPYLHLTKVLRVGLIELLTGKVSSHQALIKRLEEIQTQARLVAEDLESFFYED